MKASWRSLSVAVLPVLFHSALFAQSHPKSDDLVIVRASDLPEQARVPGDSIFLYWGANSTYLYVEQQHGTRLVVLDVTNPGKVKTVASTALNAPGPFDFVRPLDGLSELVRFRNSGAFAVLDLKKTNAPLLRNIDDLPQAGLAGIVGGDGLLLAATAAADSTPLPRDYHIVDPSKPASPALVGTVKQVVQMAVDSYTGATFLLGNEGLTIIRRLNVEDQSRGLHSYN